MLYFLTNYNMPFHCDYLANCWVPLYTSLFYLGRSIGSLPYSLSHKFIVVRRIYEFYLIPLSFRIRSVYGFAQIRNYLRLLHSIQKLQVRRLSKFSILPFKMYVKQISSKKSDSLGEEAPKLYERLITICGSKREVFR